MSNTYVRRRAAGLCGLCGQVPPSPGRASCPPCQERARKRERDKLAFQVGMGICPRCHRPGYTARVRRPRQNTIVYGAAG